MDNDTLVAYQYTFRHNGMLPPSGIKPETEKRISDTWDACNCQNCKTPCIHKGKSERFPLFIDGGRGQCANLKILNGEPFTWIDADTLEICNIPKFIIDKIKGELKA